jgi:hypothetical protein
LTFEQDESNKKFYQHGSRRNRRRRKKKTLSVIVRQRTLNPECSNSVNVCPHKENTDRLQHQELQSEQNETKETKACLFFLDMPKICAQVTE